MLCKGRHDKREQGDRGPEHHAIILRATFKQWMDANNYDPEHGKDLPAKPEPAAYRSTANSEPQRSLRGGCAHQRCILHSSTHRILDQAFPPLRWKEALG